MTICDRFLRLMSEDEWINLLNKYSYNDLFKLSEDKRIVKSFFIPPEIILSEYRTSRTLINKDHGWANRCLDRIVRTVTNGILDAKDYTDIFMIHILDGIGPRCPQCGKPLRFLGHVTYPYEVRCSKSCGTSSMNYRLWNKENSPFRTEEYKILKKRLASEMAREGRIGLANKSCSLGNTLSIYSKYDKMYFYIIQDNNKFKIGISHSFKAEDRIYVSTIYNFGKLSSKVTIYEGLTEDIVRLENEIKFDDRFINCRYYEPSSREGWMETFDIKCINLLDDFIPNYKVELIK